MKVPRVAVSAKAGFFFSIAFVPACVRHLPFTFYCSVSPFISFAVSHPSLSSSFCFCLYPLCFLTFSIQISTQHLHSSDGGLLWTSPVKKAQLPSRDVEQGLLCGGSLALEFPPQEGLLGSDSVILSVAF